MKAALRHPRARALCALVLLCAGASCQPQPTTPELAEGPVELALKTADGEPVRLSALRGKPVLIFVFTTYDDVSQLALGTLEHFLTARKDVTALGLAVQPDPEKLLPLYRDSLDVSFELTYDPDNRVVAGDSALGEIPTIPTYVLLDDTGRVAARHTGGLDEGGLAGLCAVLDE
ncbi:MAG: TlpA disulfide reductase family protein [Myxococcales bacterium]|nr:TlpA disulfide reductase family protein [Myxococcales bacterium]